MADTSEQGSNTELLTFRDVASFFSKEEWMLLHKWQQELYENVIKEIQQALLSLGPVIATAVFSLNAEGMEDLCHVEDHASERGPASDHSLRHGKTIAEIAAGIKEEEEIYPITCPTGFKPASTAPTSIKEEERIYPTTNGHVLEKAAYPTANEHSLEIQAIDSHKVPETITKVLEASIKEDKMLCPTRFEEPQERQNIANPLAGMQIPTRVTRYALRRITGYSHPGSANPTACPSDPMPPPIVHKLKTRSMNQKQPHVCSKYTNNFTNKFDIEQHQIMLTHEKLWNCTECTKTFTIRANLLRHQKIHKGIKPFVCTECRRSFAAKREFDSHRNMHKGVRPFPCTMCEKRFTGKSHLMHHMPTHTGARPFACNECEKTYKVKSDLKRHYRVHTGVRPYVCTECKKSFTRMSHLRQHQMIHSGKKPFPCNKCRKSFGQRMHLYLHQRIHSGERPFTCTECKRSFISKRTLERHQRTHKKVKYFACTVCAVQFTLKSHLKQHLTLHTGVSTNRLEEYTVE